MRQPKQPWHQADTKQSRLDKHNYLGFYYVVIIYSSQLATPS